MATSDGLIQLSALRAGVLRLSADELWREVEWVGRQIDQVLQTLNQKGRLSRIPDPCPGHTTPKKEVGCMNIALITGASSGLGREFARRPCAPAWCARSPDLTDPQSLDALRDLLAREKPTVTRLVCAPPAWAKWAGSTRSPPADSLGMIDLNCRAAVGVTQLCLPYHPGQPGAGAVLHRRLPAHARPGGLRGHQGLSPELYENPPLRAPPPGDSRHRCLPLLGEGHRVHPLAQDGKPGQFRHFPWPPGAGRWSPSPWPPAP